MNIKRCFNEVRRDWLSLGLLVLTNRFIASILFFSNCNFDQYDNDRYEHKLQRMFALFYVQNYFLRLRQMLWSFNQVLQLIVKACNVTQKGKAKVKSNTQFRTIELENNLTFWSVIHLQEIILCNFWLNVKRNKEKKKHKQRNHN